MDEQHEELKERARASRARALESRERVLRMVEESRAERAERERAELDPFAPIRREWKAPEPEPPKVSQGDRDRSLSERNAAAWDAFVQGHIELRLESFAEMLGSETGANEKAMRVEFNAKVEKLEAEIASLRADVHILREIKSGEVLDLPRLPRRSDDAA
jgi:hypothetical protein